jgi:hypothetical protein
MLVFKIKKGPRGNLVTGIWKVAGLNFGQEAGYPDRIFMTFISVPGVYWDSVTKLGHICLFTHPLQLINPN